MSLWLEVDDGDAGEGDAEVEAAGEDVFGDKNTLPLGLAPSVSAALAFPCEYMKPFRSLLVRLVGGGPLAVHALRRGGGWSDGEAPNGGSAEPLLNRNTLPLGVPLTPVRPSPVDVPFRDIAGNKLSRSLSCNIFWSRVGTGAGCMGMSTDAAFAARGVLGLGAIGVVGESGRSLDMLFDRSIPNRLFPARPKDASSRDDGVSAPLPRSGMVPNGTSIVAPEGDRGRFAPNNPRRAETATEGGRPC